MEPHFSFGGRPYIDPVFYIDVLSLSLSFFHAPGRDRIVLQTNINHEHFELQKR